MGGENCPRWPALGQEVMLHTKVTSGTWSNGGALNDPSRIGRHYHDIHRLLELPSVREWLENREEFLAP